MKPLFPYETLFGDVTLTVESLHIDDDEPRGAIRHDDRIVRLGAVDRATWEEARIRVAVAGPPAEVAATTAPTATVIVNCGPSNTRQSVILEPDPAVAGRWIGEITLARPYWFGKAELRGGIVATVEGEAHRVIGWADPWSLELDDLPNRPTVGGAIKITWANFAEPGDDRLFLRVHVDKPYYLRIDPQEPQLFLNSGFDGLEALLVDRRNRRGADRALHDQTRSSIADKTWTALFNAAIDSVDVDESGNPEWPEIDWQRTVLETLLALMWPEQSLEEVLRDAYEARRGHGASAVLQERLTPAASQQARVPRLLREGIRLVSNDSTNDDQELDR
jgi:hypothetical protein